MSKKRPVRATEFEVEDSKGRVRARFGVSGDDSPFLAFFGIDEKLRARFGVQDDGSAGLAIADEEGKVRATFGLFSDRSLRSPPAPTLFTDPSIRAPSARFSVPPTTLTSPVTRDCGPRLALPITTPNNLFGAMTIQSTQQGAFDEEDILVLQSML